MVDERGLGRVRSSVFPDLVLNLVCFWPNLFEVQATSRDSSRFEVQFWWKNLGLNEFEVHAVKFEAVEVRYIWVRSNTI